MSNYTFAAALANQLPRGIANVFVQAASGDTGWSTLGPVRNGNITLESSGVMNTYQNEYPFAGIVKASFDMLQASATEILLLTNLCNGSAQVIIQGVDGKRLYGTAGAGGAFGILAEVAVPGSITKEKVIHVTMQVGILGSAITTFFPVTTSSLTAPGTSDTFWAIANSGSLTTNLGNPGNVKPGGISTAQIQGAGESSQWQTLGRTRKTALSAKFIADTELDELYRSNVIGVHFACDFEMQQASQAASQEIAQLPNLFTDGAQFKLLLNDTTTWTISQSGVKFTYENVGDFNGLKVIRVVGGGIIPIASFSGIFS